ncbi:MAG TPA: kynureninase [Gammaproteobacteria bacterium]|jgi:kynureninase|nr:kynureninase [Gammaproteobacteria bacterium]
MLERAIALDLVDPLKECRQKFVLPNDKVYLCSNSLGLPAKNSFIYMEKQMKKWANRGAQAWFDGEDAWYHTLSQDICRNLAMILGARDNEVVVMNSLTINLHLLLTSFYRPTHSRFKIIIGEPSFSSDLYAIKSHIQLHGLNPEEVLVSVKPRDNESVLRIEDIEHVINKEGQQVALVYLSAVNYLTGQALDIKHLTTVAHQQGCIVGVDIAHAAANVPLYLHENGVDFAVGCSYKYLCGGPGGPGIAFIHSSHHEKELLRLAGWWGNDPVTRFQMDVLPAFIPFGGAASWQVSTPPVLGLQPLLASLKLLVEVGIDNLRKKSLLQTDFLLELLSGIGGDHDIVTPMNGLQRGNQISIRLPHSAKAFVETLHERGFICDSRAPNILRVSLSPLYNSFQDIYYFVMNGMKKTRGVAV